MNNGIKRAFVMEWGNVNVDLVLNKRETMQTERA
jgi:hypothetical protein